MALPDQCPECKAELVPIYQPNTKHLERVECMGDPKHVYAVLREEGTDPLRYKLGAKIEPQ